MHAVGTTVPQHYRRAAPDRVRVRGLDAKLTEVRRSDYYGLDNDGPATQLAALGRVGRPAVHP